MDTNIAVKSVHFPLAKFLIERFHRTNKAPIGHRESFILMKNTNNYEPVVICDDYDLYFSDWFHKAYPDPDKDYDDFIYSFTESGDPCLYSNGFKVLGILTIGNPVARFKEKNIFEINRICFLPSFNPLKDGFELPSYFVKEAIKQFNYNYDFNKIITYIHQQQKGKYLEYAGFKKDKNITYSTNSIGWGNRLKRSISNLKPKTRYVFENKKGGFYPA